jgi:hypothetical protein
MTTAPNFKNWDELRDALVKHQQLLEWLEKRLTAMGFPGVTWVRYAEVERNIRTGEELISVGFEQYDDNESASFTWEELMDESNDTYRRLREEKRVAALEEARKRQVQERKDRVKNLEHQLETARRLLEETP